jgi:hypothetical protein
MRDAVPSREEAKAARRIYAEAEHAPTRWSLKRIQVCAIISPTVCQSQNVLSTKDFAVYLSTGVS